MDQGLPTDLIRLTGKVLAAAILIVVVYLLLAYGTYSLFTSQIPSGNDFYPRWRGTRALIMERRDPYSDEFTLEIQQGMYRRPAREDEDQVAFAYPLYVAVVILPFSFFPYPQAQVPCISFLVLPTLVAVTIILRAFDWSPPPVGRLVLALWATQPESDLLTGLIQRRDRIPVGFFPAIAVFVLLSLVLLPTWILSFISELSRYQTYAITCRAGESPLGAIVDCLLPSHFSAWATLLLSIALGALSRPPMDPVLQRPCRYRARPSPEHHRDLSCSCTGQQH